ncbi:peptidase M61 [Galbibacter pacificus]|uniref:Peptidase M61 n=1 Tax=Galbibacter pacificus TaxID=2996052 RepID=A0ABT6FVJ6_9FLAO|nr:peptidase M61 [Galbibacter pacificus]MDG3583787.1 peptidase M61 [Galbibacter pacificus]MDG3587295.1 peptidase M61 [Galbibacter pacificus]
MKKLIFTLLAASIVACTPKVNDLATSMPIETNIDLVNVKNDMVHVSVDPGRFTAESINFYIPKTVPGTYSNNDYGQFIENLTAYDYNNKPLQATSVDVNTWKIDNATQLDRIEYDVNDSFDTEGEVEDPVFSPAGSNIEANKDFFLNLHMFVGYFDNLKEQSYLLHFKHPSGFEASTSLHKATTKAQEANTDTFLANRYFEVTDNPIMYSKPDSQTFSVNDIEVTLSVYSPNKVYSAVSIKNEMEKMMKAQKTFLGDINSTKTYNILLFLGAMEKGDPTGFGALEHHTSTTVVLPETMPKEDMVKTMTDVVSHEFFHIVTPLTVHSEEIQYFDYNNPKMSEHLWMYEGVTEYFANLFQINQGLIDEQDFYDRIATKIQNSKRYNDSLSFTKMSKNVLVEPYKDQYANVYEKGALIGMCLDIIIREESNGEKGILWLMKQLSKEYGMDKSFKDDELFDKIVSLTYPEVRTFFNTYVIGDTPIPYDEFLNKAGLTFHTEAKETGFFLNGQIPYIDVNPQNNEIFVRKTALNSSMKALGLKSGDVIKSVNGTEFTMENIRNVIIGSMSWQPETEVNMVINRDGEELTLKGKVGSPSIEVDKIAKMETTTPQQDTLREAWLKG